MEKKIEDYLHLYLGCEIKHKFGTDNSWNRDKLWGVSFRDCIIDHQGNTKSNESFNNIKLILRPLSDISEDEIIEVANISDAFPVGWNEKDGYYKIQDVEHPNEGKEIVCDDKYAIRITYKYSIYYFNYVTKNGAIYLPNSIDIFRYLLSKHFDLFGLIESGLALDKTKISQTANK